MKSTEPIILTFDDLVRMDYGLHLLTDDGWKTVELHNHHTIWITPTGHDRKGQVKISTHYQPGYVYVEPGDQIELSINKKASTDELPVHTVTKVTRTA